MKLIAGLGNPGKEYEKTRHNSGFMAIDLLADRLDTGIDVKKFNALVQTVRIQGQSVLLMKPLTYMNESGSAVAQAVNFYHIDPSDILILHDDMDLPTGSVRIRASGSGGGQKGMKSIIDALKTAGEHDLVPDWVLSPVPKAERDVYDAALLDASKAAYDWVFRPFNQVMNDYNIKAKK